VVEEGGDDAKPRQKKRRNSKHHHHHQHRKRSHAHARHKVDKREIGPLDDVFFIESFDVQQNFLNENDSKRAEAEHNDDEDHGGGSWIMTQDVVDDTATVDAVVIEDVIGAKRVKRKSGKTTGALSRAKAGSDTTSSKKSGSRHKHGEGKVTRENRSN
jgi:hypothetical protein